MIMRAADFKQLFSTLCWHEQKYSDDVNKLAKITRTCFSGHTWVNICHQTFFSLGHFYETEHFRCLYYTDSNETFLDMLDNLWWCNGNQF